MDETENTPESEVIASEHSPEEDAATNKKKAVRELILMAVVLFLIFVVFLPQFIDYDQVIDSLFSLTWGQILLLAFLSLPYMWFTAGVYNVLIPGLRWWPGWKAWAASNSVAFLAPPGADLAIRFGMYRTAGIGGDAAGAGIVLSWFFSTGYKLALPVIALTWVLIAEGFEDPTFVTLTIIGLAAVIGGAGVTALILYRESAAERVGTVSQRWYNGMAGGRWKFPEAEGLGTKLVDFRAQVIETVKAKWFPASMATFAAQGIFFLMLVLSMRFMGVGPEDAPLGIIFDAYAVGLLLSMIPIFPGGLGVVELAYVAIIVGGTDNTELANAVTAGAFAHRIFSWLVPILIGLIPLAAWRRQNVKARETQSSE